MYEVFRAKWWMKHYGSPTPKRSAAYANVPFVGQFQRGKLKKVKKSSCFEKEKPCRAYLDSEGKKRFHGTKFLQQTQ